MAKEYIEREASLKTLTRYLYASHVQMSNSISQGMQIAIKSSIELLDNVPAADVVEVVRCGKCTHAFEGPLNELLCKRKMLGMVRPEDFCSFGERRDNDD